MDLDNPSPSAMMGKDALRTPAPNGVPAAPQKRVLLFFPVFAHVLPMAFQNFLRLVNVASRLCPEYIFDPWVVERSSLVTAMNRAVETCLTYEHYAMIAFDDDCIPELHQFPHGDPRRYQVIPRMLKLMENNPILMGVGYMRGYPHTTTVGKLYDHGAAMVVNEAEDELMVKGYHWVEDIEAPEYVAQRDPNGLLDVDFCGVPIMGIRRDVFLKLPQPLFETRDHLGRASTHDIYFCNLAKAHGFSIKVDTAIDCGHIIEPPIVNRITKRELATVLVPQGAIHGNRQRPEAGGADRAPAHQADRPGPGPGLSLRPVHGAGKG